MVALSPATQRVDPLFSEGPLAEGPVDEFDHDPVGAEVLDHDVAWLDVAMDDTRLSLHTDVFLPKFLSI